MNDKETEILNLLSEEPYPTDIFPEVTPEQIQELNHFCKMKFGFPIDRFSAHIGRVLRKPLRELAEVVLANNQKQVRGEELQNMVAKFLKEHPHAGASFSFCEGFKSALNTNSADGWKDEDLIDFHNFIFRHENKFLKMGEYLNEFKSLTKPPINNEDGTFKELNSLHHHLLKHILKQQFEVYNPLREEVVKTEDIKAAFKKFIGVEIEDENNF